MRVIDTLRERIRAHRQDLQSSETRTRMALIDPLLTALGWEVSDLELVMPEYNVSGTWADYALLGPDGKPAAIIEAKKLDERLDNHRRQMLNYANMEGVPYAGLTDGNRWELYAVFEQRPIDERRILQVSIADAPAHECTLQLMMLWHPNLASGSPTAANAPILDRTARNDEPAPEPPPVPVPAAAPLTPDWVALPALDWQKGEKLTTIRFPDGQESKVQIWCDLIVSTTAWLWSEGRLTADNAPADYSKKHYILGTMPINSRGKSFRRPTYIKGTPFVVEGYISGQRAISHTKTLLERCNIDPAEVYFQVGQ